MIHFLNGSNISDGYYILFTFCKHVPIKTNLHICHIYKNTYGMSHKFEIQKTVTGQEGPSTISSSVYQ